MLRISLRSTFDIGHSTFRPIRHSTLDIRHFFPYGISLLLLLTLFAGPVRSAHPVDLIVHHGVIHAGEAQDRVHQAMAIAGERIIALGRNREIRRLAGPGTLVIDLKERLVLPGFNDAHVHFLEGGFQLASIDLRDAKTPAEFSARIADFARRRPPGEWITGGNWDHENWPGAPLPRKQDVDAAAPANPLFISRLDGHMALANSIALRMGGVDRDTPSPAGGLIVREANGEPTGILKDAAMGLVSRQIPEASFEQKLVAGRAASEHAARLGVTSIQDMSASTDIGVYQELARRGELQTRVYAVRPLADWRRLADTGARAPFGSHWLRIGGLKGFADGSLGSSTALFFQAYDEDSANFGLSSDEMPNLRERVRAADTAHLQVMIHAIGDRANHEVLSVFEETRRERDGRDRRWRIEHAQHLRLADVPRFAAAHVIASMQPYHAADDGRWAEKRIGRARCEGTYAFRSLLDSGARLAFGSDWPVAPLDPIQGIAAAVTRQTLDGKHPRGWVPAQKITPREAVTAFTLGSAYAEFTENEKGTLEAGKLADFVVLDRDVFRIPPDEIKSAKVLLTVTGGKVVFRGR